jgi:hypothetical protein
MNKKLITGILFTGFALAFGITSLNYRVGTLTDSGPGMFPIIVSGILLLIGVSIIIESFFVAKEPLDLKINNVAIITLGLISFALITNYIGMVAGIFALVIIASFAANSFSILRVTKIAFGLIVVAYTFKHFLGLNLPL